MDTYLDMPQLSYAVPHTEQLQPAILQSDGALVRAYMDNKYPGRQNGREGPLLLLPWTYE
jgi:hypothetical protein